MTSPTRAAAAASVDPASDPLWYKDAVIYEVHVRAFMDADGDGMGDFAGMTQKLDYLQELGITAIWLLPFYESPLRDDGYDIADYRKIHPSYGTLRDFKRFLAEAHARGLRVITELVINHTSDQHAWFQRARRAPRGSAYRDYYVWSDTAAEYAEARIIFKDFERSNWTWDPVAGQYYWHRFYSHQPDLNFDNPRVRQEILDIVDYWFAMGVDGFRLDAVPYLFEREGTSCENLPETHAFLKELRAHVDRKFPGRMLLAEANQWPEDAARYFGDGDECHMAYHFPLMPRLFMAVRMEDRFPITEILDQTPEIPANAQWALFLRNHDELTLEMVTDEERDYMYRVYAAEDRARINLGIRRRLAPLLGHNRRLIELMNALLLSMKGTPVIYYGDELGMGDNIYLGDRDSVRTPMQWSADRNAGFSRANPQRLYLPVIIDPEYHYESINVDAQQANPSLLLWWMRRLIALRTRYRAFSRGSMTFLDTDNRRVLAFLREYEGERIVVVANLSRFTQAVNVNIGACASLTPVEMFGHTHFPPVTHEPYFLSLGPHAFYWFLLEPASGHPQSEPGQAPPLTVDRDWQELLNGRRKSLEAALSAYLPGRRWFGAKSRNARRLTIIEAVPFRTRNQPDSAYVLARVEYDQGEPDSYAILLSAVPADRAAAIERTVPWALITTIADRGGTVLHLVDGLALPEVATAFLDAFRSRAKFSSARGTLAFSVEPGFRYRPGPDEPPAAIHRGEQSNTSVIYPGRFILKFIRRIEPGIHPQVEMQRFLRGTQFGGSVPHLAGTISYSAPGQKAAFVGVLEELVTAQYDAWTFAVDELGRMLEEVAAARIDPPAVPRRAHPLDAPPTPPAMREAAASWLQFARTLGERTGHLHAALASDREDPAFAPERYTPFYQRALAQAFRSQARDAFRGLRGKLDALDEAAREHAESVLAGESAILQRLQAVAGRPLASARIRCHGDLHLGQVLIAGREPIFIDFEGEPVRSLGERRVKRSPLRDVAGMLRSFHYASRHALRELVESQAAGSGTDLETWARAWNLWSAAEYLAGYFDVAGSTGLLPSAPEEHRFLLDSFLLDKALYEVRYELDNRPTWVDIPLQGIIGIIDVAILD
ncbi:MAG TPA: maltose alpha-D-glucosyltransferase [Tepidiformaceae bacterium]|nr:maltose alpha-D-glucosyltransferase [Tepidiformaceae bacterium]